MRLQPNKSARDESVHLSLLTVVRGSPMREKYAKTLLGEKDIESILLRLDRLSLEELKMAVARTLDVVYSPNHTQRLHWNQCFSASPQPNPPPISPRELMWQKIKDEYVPIDHPSALACQTPDNGKPVAAIRGALKSHSCIITSTIIRIAMGHCFDANYSQRFRPRSDDILTCPHVHSRPHLHTCHHIIFQCSQYANKRRKFLPRPW